MDISSPVIASQVAAMAYMAVLNSPAYETGFAEPSSAEARELKNAKRGY